MAIRSELFTFWIWNTTIPSVRRYSFEALQSITRRIGFLIAFKSRRWGVELEESWYEFWVSASRNTAAFYIGKPTFKCASLVQSYGPEAISAERDRDGKSESIPAYPILDGREFKVLLQGFRFQIFHGSTIDKRDILLHGDIFTLSSFYSLKVSYNSNISNKSTNHFTPVSTRW